MSTSTASLNRAGRSNLVIPKIFLTMFPWPPGRYFLTIFLHRLSPVSYRASRKAARTKKDASVAPEVNRGFSVRGELLGFGPSQSPKQQSFCQPQSKFPNPVFCYPCGSCFINEENCTLSSRFGSQAGPPKMVGSWQTDRGFLWNEPHY